MMRSESELTPENEGSKLVRTPEELKIIEEQVHAPAAEVNYWTLFRYATTWDLLCLLMGTLCAIAGGSALSLMALLIGRLASSFRDQYTGVITFVQADHNVSSNSLFFIYLAIGEFAATAIGMATFSAVGEHITLGIREEYVKAVLRQNIAYFDKLGAGEVASRASTDINLIREGISEKVVLVLMGFSCFVSALVVSFIESWKLALIVMTSIIALILVMGGVAKIAIRFKSKSIECQAAADNVVEETLSSIRTVTAFGAQEKLANRYDACLQQAEYWALLNRTTTGCMVGLSLCIIYAEHALSFWQGSRFLVSGDISLIAIITIQIAIMMGGAYFGQSLPHLHSFTSAVAAANKVFSTIDRISALDPQSEEGLKLDSIQGEVEFRDLSFVYPSRPDVTIFNGLNLTLRAGETTAIVGPSGCGKSTVVALMECFYKPLAGTILLDGHDIAALNLRWWRQQVALVGQEPVLFNGSIFENIEFGLIDSEYGKKSKQDKLVLVTEAAKTANAHDFITSLPSGYDTQVGDGGHLLSGGQRQRVAIARAIVSDPKILLLDEATSNLDATAEAAVQEAIEHAVQGRTTLIIAHKLSTIKNADKIVVISDGRIVEQGSHSELAAQGGAYTELLRAQDMGGTATYIGERSAPVVKHTSEEPMKLSRSRAKSVEKVGSAKVIEPLGEKGIHEAQKASQQKLESSSIRELSRFMWSLNKHEAWSIVIGSCFSVLSGANQPVRGILFAHSILALSEPGKIRQQSNFWAGMFLMLGLVQLVASSFQGLAFARSSARLVHRAQSLAFQSILNQDIPFFDKLEHSAGSLTSLLSSEASQLTGLSGATVGAILVFVTTVLGSIGIALGFGWKLSLVGMSVMAPLIVCGFVRFWLLTQLEERTKQTTQAGTFVSQATTSIRTVASLTMEMEILQKYRQMIVSEARSRTWFIIKSSSAYALSQSFMFLAAALGFWYGGKLVARGEYDILQFFICFSETLFGAQAAGAILSFAPEVGTGRSSAESFKRLIESKGVDLDSGEKKNVVKGTLEFRDVYFHYPERQTPVLQGLSFEAKVGQFTAIVGASGSGKSTALALIERFYEPTSGSILLDEEDISRLSLRDYREHLALVSQETTLYDGTIRENILFDRDAIEENLLADACKAANIYDFIISLPDGFNTLIGPKGSSLSGGQRQRLAIARALLREPKILLLDEATSALDSSSEEIVEEALKRASKGRTTIAIAHRLSSIYHADLIYVLDAGRVVESGTHAELMTAKGVYWNMVGLQSFEVKGSLSTADTLVNIP